MVVVVEMVVEVVMVLEEVEVVGDDGRSEGR